MGKDINIPMSDLERMNTSLANIIDEFDNAGSRSNNLEGWIGSPHGHGELRHEVDRFEGDWDDKRETLKGHLDNLKQHVEKLVKGWTDFDLKAAENLDRSVNEPQVKKPGAK